MTPFNRLRPASAYTPGMCLARQNLRDRPGEGLVESSPALQCGVGEERKKERTL
jgi:hypothetical protein